MGAGVGVHTAGDGTRRCARLYDGHRHPFLWLTGEGMARTRWPPGPVNPGL
jgi:hypothetical protein